ncbi:bifunctional phosphoribosylaminoimidazolecarboxamide formyltransferase/IMP cyclohydrolase [Suttonella ornithocola]|uniref:Bifunctional purine biosynthesis protein PurH n=1 Tax=Suttonella ornithocola TaxID=279832 RepID=A0A380MMX1_9GAMM|nr:bifunctional phosphoribosylaminoimidazolecarboxamide formyltransferase/IMP cyclohydrolase [Suttonella ornithocola]SUO93598.1 Bifunctional purine biosynthesis protein PurH [Suttonella ornithocola]
MNKNILRPKRALISVSDKSGLVDFAKRLVAQNIELLSTGGTASMLREAGVPVKDVAEHTNFPEIMGGRVKTLHPKIHGGILARRGTDEAIMTENQIAPIDLVIVNLYPFRQTIEKEGVTLEEAIENIDIGGPSMVRSAAKNHIDVTVVVNPADYPSIIEAIENEGIPLEMRQQLAAKAFSHTADYDRAIAIYLSHQYSAPKQDFPEQLTLNYRLAELLRYGENPHQRAAFYQSNRPTGASLAMAKQHQGKQLSYNNYADADAALRTVLRFTEDPACVIVKHANPCGVSLGENCLQAYEHAYRTDPTSAFGGIIAFNRALDVEAAQEIISRQFVEVLLAPAYSSAALEVLKQKPNIRVLEIKSDGHDATEWQVQSIRGGILVQDWDNGALADGELNVVTQREPTHDELVDLLFAWRVVKSVKSNAIVLAKDLATLGIGAGQTSRVYSAKIAAMKARDEHLMTTDMVLASDAFFPFRDGVDAAADAGVSAIIQPGGSVRDQEVIDAANEHNIAMIFTGMRHFRH